MNPAGFALFDRSLVGPAILDSFRKLSPRVQLRNPVMFVVYVGSILTSVLWIQAATGKGEAPPLFILSISLWLWFTLLFANFAEALAEGRSKAQAASLRGIKKSVLARKLASASRRPVSCAATTAISSKRARSCLLTARSSKASPPSMKAPSPVNPRR
jgi:K+-transporting ATPase ATPase B chain